MTHNLKITKRFLFVYLHITPNIKSLDFIMVKKFKVLHPENYNKLFASSFYLRILVRMNILRYIWTKLNRKLLWKQRRTYVLLILIALGMIIAAVVYFKYF